MNEGRRTFAISILVLAAIAAFAFWMLQGDGAAIADVVAPGPTKTPSAQPANAALTPPPTERTEAAPAAPAPSAAPAADPMLAHVRGRCVDEKGTPLAGCAAKLDAFGGNSDRMAMQGKVDWHDPDPVVTGDDGRFDVGFAPPSGMQFTLDVSAEGRVPRTGRWGQIDAAKILDVGDIVLVRGFAVRGLVVDEQGAPVEKVGVGFNNLPLPIAAEMSANNSRFGWSAANGEFLVRTPLPVGTWSIEAQANGIRHVSPTQVTVTERGADPVVVTVRRMPSIQGLVVDEQGLPVKDVRIEAELTRSGRMASARSREDGTFTIYAVDAEPKPVKLRVDDPGPCEPPEKADERLWEWGAKDVRFELRRAVTCELLVVERATGAPVTQFAVSCRGVRSSSSLQSDLRLSGEHPGGRVTIDKVWRGTNVLQVMPLDRALLPSAMVEFVATDAGAPAQRVEVDRLAAATVLVTKANGTPIVGSKVEVVVKGTMPWDANAWAQDSRTGNRGFSSDPKTRFHERISEAVSGADGRAAVFIPPTADGLVVRVTGEHPPALVDPAVFAIGQDMVVVPRAAGSITGVVRVQGLDASRIRVSRHAGEPQGGTNFDDPVPLQPNGAFAIAGLAPGRYQLRLTYSVPWRTEHGGSSGGANLRLPETDVVVQAEQETPVEIDATALVPASVRGRVLLDGAPPNAARVFVQADTCRYGQFVVGNDGGFTADGLLPGRYRVGLVVGDFVAGEGDTILQDDSFELAAGQQLARDFLFARRRLVITLLQADGKTPAAGVMCFCTGEGVHLPAMTSDAQGRLVLDPAPSVPLHIRPSGMGGIALGPVQVPAGQASHEVTLKLPEKPGR